MIRRTVQGVQTISQIACFANPGNRRRRGEIVPMSFKVTAVLLTAGLLLCTGCGSSSSSEGTGSERVAGFEPIPEDATIEALAAASAEMEGGGAGTADSAGTSASGTAGDGAAGDGAADADGAQSAEEGDGSGAFAAVFTGDVLLQDYTMAIYDQSGLDGLLAQELQEEMADADLVMINEEFPFGTGGTAADKTYTFIADPSYVSVLTDMGVDVVSLANNHVLDYGTSVLSQTFTTLDAAVIDYLGAGESLERAMAWASYDLNGTAVAVLSASRVIPETSWDVQNSQPGVFSTYDASLLTAQIQAAKAENDLVIVYVHWGVENSETPEEYQRTLARQYIDAGADLVIGTHPHVLQGIEYYKGVPIVYSLGNFIFNYTIPQTVMLKITYGDALAAKKEDVSWAAAAAEEEETLGKTIDPADESDSGDASVSSDSAGLTLQLIPAAASNAHTYLLEGNAAQSLYDSMESISFGVNIDENGYVYPAE